MTAVGDINCDICRCELTSQKRWVYQRLSSNTIQPVQQHSFSVAGSKMPKMIGRLVIIG